MGLAIGNSMTTWHGHTFHINGPLCRDQFGTAPRVSDAFLMGLVCMISSTCFYSASHVWIRRRRGLLPDTQNCELCMRRECRERFPRHWLQRKPLASDPDMHHGTCITHVPWCMSGSLTRDGGQNVPHIPGACATRNFTYMVRGPWGQTYGNEDRVTDKHVRF